MYIDYFYWQYVSAPLWFVRLFWTLQRALLREFSVGYLLRTLFSYWRKDSVSYHANSLSGIGLALAWNAISRVIGFMVRSTVLATWIVAEGIFLLGAATTLLVFLLWPLLMLVSLAAGIVLIIA